ncbi:TIGR03668 family PPOX class F420-dependent oxidoreductase [Nocardia blacklockiae]|uniref:TIGR03668 family PPOX class F420-dependent oxidoreductase n=1 Tax=Nocardia blacklockiae TaxID=480036 RepID=UPI001893936F|nr:TIGR03668 family PPOX class F420-dependent oxidoreductase [Nocardia blacklockiae]MBF6173978.1 TIGR03668 family PPOX class F420-dependent oxidoreductase [Nocardia blacklockiae]
MRLDEQEALRRLRAARVARLATVSADGQPHLVPVTFAVSPDGRAVVIAIDHKPKTTTNLRRLRNIAAHDRVSLLADEYDEEWSHLWWVRVDGTARIRTAAPDRVEPVAWLIAKYPQYQGNSPQGPVIHIAVETLIGWSYRG